MIKCFYQLSLFLGNGEISFAKDEFLVSPNSSKVNVSIVRSHFKDKVDVKWITSPNLGLSGLINFEKCDIEKIIEIDLQNATNNQSISIELLQPTDDYQLGECKVAKISHICMYLFAIVVSINYYLLIFYTTIYFSLFRYIKAITKLYFYFQFVALL